MTLGTHAAVGGSLAVLVPGHPVLAFTIGFLSHFILDSIPHYDYRILSLEKKEGDALSVDMKFGKLFIFDLFRIGFDATLGIIFLMFFFYDTPYFSYIIFIGAIGAILPDVLQFAYFKLRKEPLASLQRFHMWIHADSDINHRPLLGISCQSTIAFLVLGIVLLVI